MNSINQLHNRLLEGFPVKELRDFFKVDGKKEDIVVDIILKESTTNIENFVFNYFGFLHQHIHVYELNSRVSASLKDMMSGKRIYKSINKKNSSWMYLHATSVSYYDTISQKVENLEFLIPVKIEVNSKIVKIYFNTFARDIRPYFNHDIYPNRAGSLEEEIINDIKTHLIQVMYRLDLNRGIKHLWNIDVIDAVVVKNKKSSSVKLERMDGSYTYKLQYPVEWKKLMLTPIQKTKFISINGGVDVKLFDCNPSLGYISISNYSDSNNCVNNLVDLVLRNN